MSCSARPMHRLAGEGGAVAVDRHGGALAALPARGFQGQEAFDGVGASLRACAATRYASAPCSASRRFSRRNSRKWCERATPSDRSSPSSLLSRNGRSTAPVVTSGRPRVPPTLAAWLRRPVEPHVGQHEHFGQLQMRAATASAKKSSMHAGRIVAVEQRRAERAERAGPGAHDRDAERHGRRSTENGTSRRSRLRTRRRRGSRPAAPRGPRAAAWPAARKRGLKKMLGSTVRVTDSRAPRPGRSRPRPGRSRAARRPVAGEHLDMGRIGAAPRGRRASAIMAPEAPPISSSSGTAAISAARRRRARRSP